MRALPAALGNILVFALVGVWHGATSNYILWGLYNGVFLAVTALLEPRYKRMNERCARLTASRGFHAFRVLRTFAIVNIGWFFDRCATAGDAVRMMGGIFARPEWAQVRLDNLGISPLDARILAVGVLLLAAVSLLGENGKDVRGWLAARAADSLGGDAGRNDCGAAARRMGKRLQRGELYLFQLLRRTPSTACGRELLPLRFAQHLPRRGRSAVDKKRFSSKREVGYGQSRMMVSDCQSQCVWKEKNSWERT